MCSITTRPTSRTPLRNRNHKHQAVEMNEVRAIREPDFLASIFAALDNAVFFFAHIFVARALGARTFWTRDRADVPLARLARHLDRRQSRCERAILFFVCSALRAQFADLLLCQRMKRARELQVFAKAHSVFICHISHLSLCASRWVVEDL